MTARRKTVAEELRRRQDCRYGLRGVEVSLRDRPGDVFVVLGSSWDEFQELRLELLPRGLLAEYEADRLSHSEGPFMRTDRMIDFTARWTGRRLDDVPAADATLLTTCPIECDYWC
jgi:hypothetical protein